MVKRNLLVVEGADCMGKTTLVTQLQEKLRWGVLHTGGPKTDLQLEEGMRKVESLETPYIIDRLPYLSEIAYRPITRDGVEVSPEEQRVFFERVARLNPVLVVCRKRTLPDVVAVERPHKPLEYWLKVQLGYSGIVKRYDDLIEQLAGRIPIYVYDWGTPGEPEALEEFLNFYLFPEAEG